VPRFLAIPVILAAAALAGCAGTRTGQAGRLPTGDQLVTVVVSQDRRVVERECNNPLAVGPVYGCQMSSPIVLPDGRPARSVKIVRYTDALPSTMAFEIEIHELCHAVAALQTLDDPCHLDGRGFLQASRPR